MGPDVAEIAYRQDTEFEMLHRLRILFRCSDLRSLGKETLSAKIHVSRVFRNGLDSLESTEVIYDSLQPNWVTPVIIDYRLNDNDDYVAQLVDCSNEVETILGEVTFKLAELITSKGEFIFKPFEMKEIMLELEEEQILTPVLGIMGIEEKDGERDAVEFSLQVNELPDDIEASFFQI